MHTYRVLQSRQNDSAAESNQEKPFTSLQKFIICFLLVTTLLFAPAAAVPSFDIEGTQLSWQCKNPNVHFCKYASITLPPNDAFLLPVSSRDLKLRASQKKQVPSSEYLGEISTTGDVFFTNSPIVTSLHLQQGITGNVHLQTSQQTSRPEFCHVYNVFELSLDTYPAGSETVVRYMLPLSEIEEKGYNPVDITLCIYEDNVWQKLHTIYSIDDVNAYFESVTTALGTFAIVSDGAAEEDGSFSARINTGGPSPIMLDVSPACFITHPYTAIV